MPPTRSPTALAALRPLTHQRMQVRAAIPRASFHQTTLLNRKPESASASEEPGAVPDELASKKFKGVTGGGEPLDSSSPNAVPKPKISNLSVPGSKPGEGLTEEQKKEVEEHNKEFAEKHDTESRSADDKVDKKFWSQ